ncbi:hypothetical protein AVEN_202269-1 [Araneus ventricosus]|uniref:Uncharacterized protein n=1 Tax=Araneus ventricosus TaxID=182803 RepID=A0A4Y2CP02_ARAVE|nr:hypothetical protein AVEN_202269-1 [Araneus ventricosus]
MSIVPSFSACEIVMEVTEQCYEEQLVNIQNSQVLGLIVFCTSKEDAADQCQYTSLLLTLQSQQDELFQATSITCRFETSVPLTALHGKIRQTELEIASARHNTTKWSTVRFTDCADTEAMVRWFRPGLLPASTFIVLLLL